MGWFERAKQALAMGSASITNSRRAKGAAAPRRQRAFETLEPRLPLSGAPGLVPVGSQPTGALTGKIVYAAAGHGWQWNSTLNRFATDRPNLLSMVEDFGNQDQHTYYVDYLFRAGATVAPMRPVGRQANEVVLDNDSPGVTYSGAWSDNTVGPRWYDEDYGVGGADAVKYRFANVNSGSETATATYTPNIPQAGFYPVYTWVPHGSNRTNQLYKINHTGGQTEVRVDHRMVGNGWVYLGTYHFNSGSSSALGSVVISNHSTSGGSVVIADAIRFGNGMGDLPWGNGGIGTGNISGYPREDENALMWLWRGVGQGVTPSSIIGTGNVSAPLRMAAEMNVNSNPYGTSIYISFHSNATTGNPDTATARGAIGLIHSTNPTPNQTSLATFVGRQINVDMRALDGQFEHNWSTRTTYTLAGSYGEITNGWANGEFDATIVEVAFHDNTQDAQLLRDPRIRDQIGRSTYEATLEHFRQTSTPQPPNITLPSPVSNVRAVSNATGQVTVSWTAGPVGGGVGGTFGNAATGFRIYASTDGYGFDGGTLVSGAGTTSTTLSGYDPTIPYYFRIAAVNDGGESKASEVLTVLPGGGPKQVLIVNGFDRHDRDQNFKLPYAYGGGGITDRVWARYNNSFDYVVQVHSAIHAARPGIQVASTSNEAVISGAVNLNDYHTVIWILGTEGGGSSLGGSLNVNRTFDATEQTKVEQFLAAGGNLFLSGSDIAWDLDQQNNGRTFYENSLKGNYVANSANTYTATPAAGGIFAGMSNLVFSNGAAFSSLDGQYQNVNSADVIAAQSGAQLALNYSGGTGGGAAIQVPGTGGRGSIVMFAFPFESITSAPLRQQVIERVFDFFSLSANMPGVALKKFVNGEDADVPNGPTLSAGTNATLTYEVTNTGNVSLSNVVVVDDNGTPGDVGDDFMPSLTSGDTNSNGLLDVGETWIFTAIRTVVAGQFSSTGTVTAQDNLAEVVMSADSIHYFGSAPAIHVKTYVDSNDADSPPGPVLTVGDTATFVYIVTNTGNVPLSNVTVVDDNGTPGDTADDVNAMYASGDSNLNGMLDWFETWVFVRQSTVLAGQQTHVGTAIGIDSINVFAFASDPANYFGLAAQNADFNGDGFVDAADYVIWRRYAGSSVPPGTQGDANHDGEVNGDDYDIWTAQFGISPGSGSGASSQAASEEVVAAESAGVASNSLVIPVAVDDQEEVAGWIASTRETQSGQQTSGSGSRQLSRPLPWAGRAEWEMLLTTLAERKAQRELPTAPGHTRDSIQHKAADHAFEKLENWAIPGHNWQSTKIAGRAR